MPRKKTSDTRVLGPTYLRDWRQSRGLTQMQAAELIGIEYTNLGKIERGLVAYTQQVIEAAAKAYGCSPGDLIATHPDAVARSPESQLRAALLAFGVDSTDLGRAVSSVKVFVDDLDEQSSQPLPDDQSEPANPRREAKPSRRQPQRSGA